MTGKLARYLADAGRIDEAAAFVAEARAMATPDDFATRAEIESANASLALARGDPGAALAANAAQIDAFVTTDYIMGMADAVRRRGEILHHLGQGEEADAALDEALAMYDRKGASGRRDLLRAWRAERTVGTRPRRESE